MVVRVLHPPFNISVQFIYLICMSKNNVIFVFVANELQNVKFLYYPVLLNSLRYLIGVYVCLFKATYGHSEECA